MTSAQTRWVRRCSQNPMLLSLKTVMSCIQLSTLNFISLGQGKKGWWLICGFNLIYLYEDVRTDVFLFVLELPYYQRLSSGTFFKIPHWFLIVAAVMAERLRRWTRNPMGFPRAGSNPAHSESIQWNHSVLIWLSQRRNLKLWIHSFTFEPPLWRLLKHLLYWVLRTVFFHCM